MTSALPTSRSALVAACAVLSCAILTCSQARSGRSFNGNWDEKKARELAVVLSRTWYPTLEQELAGRAQGPLQSKPYAVLPFDKGGTSRYLVLVGVAPNDYTCHACAPITGAVMFHREGNAWEAGFEQPTVITQGANGNPPKARVQRIGPSEPAIAFELDAMAQGYEVASLILVAEVEAKLKTVLSIETAGSNEAAGGEEKDTFRWNSDIAYVPGPVPEHFDIRVVMTGTKAQAGGAVGPYSATKLYRFSGGVYQPVSP